jgi:SNF2 family DNA or RNA helicase
MVLLVAYLAFSHFSLLLFTVVLLDKLLPKLKQEGHKILIFSQMVKMLDLISEYCEFRDFKYERLDGRIRGSDRQKAIDRFEREADSFLFLLSTRAGGVGINLVSATICILFDRYVCSNKKKSILDLF